MARLEVLPHCQCMQEERLLCGRHRLFRRDSVEDRFRIDGRVVMHGSPAPTLPIEQLSRCGRTSLNLIYRRCDEVALADRVQEAQELCRVGRPDNS